jgi:hypothetical protein
VDKVVRVPRRRSKEPLSVPHCGQCGGPLGKSETHTCAECILRAYRREHPDSELPGFPPGWTLGRDPWPYSTGDKKRGGV